MVGTLLEAATRELLRRRFLVGVTITTGLGSALGDPMFRADERSRQHSIFSYPPKEIHRLTLQGARKTRSVALSGGAEYA